MKKSWKTTLFGSIGGIATLVATYATDPKTKAIAATVSSICIALLGGTARDNNVTSEQAGVGPK